MGENKRMTVDITPEFLSGLEKEFEGILSSMIATHIPFPKQFPDELSPYSEWSEEDLVRFTLWHIAWSRGLIIRILLTKIKRIDTMGRTIQRQKRKAEKIETDWLYEFLQNLVKNPTPGDLAAIYFICPEDESIRKIVLCWLNYQDAVRELNRRLEQSKIGKAIFELVQKGDIACFKKGERQPLIESLLSALRLKKETYRPSKEDSEDLDSIVMEKTWEKHKKIGEHINKEAVEEPSFFLPNIQGLSTQIESTWDRWNANWLKEEIVGAYKYLIPLFHGDDIREGVRQSLKDHFEKWNAQKRTGKEYHEFKKKSQKNKKNEEEYKGFQFELSMESLREEIEGSTGKDEDSFQKVERQDIGALSYELDEESFGDNRIEEIYKFAEKRWGSKAIRFLKAWQNQDEPTIEKASRKAGFSRQTGESYLRELKKSFRKE